MINETYNNRMLYYNFMKNFLEGKITAWNFRVQYWDQRHHDLSENKISGYADNYEQKIENLIDKDRIFKQYTDDLYEKGLAKLDEYEKAAEKLNIKGELFFMGMWYFIDDYIREYYPSDKEGFDPKFDVDEETLTKIIHAVFDVLERNKDRWEYNEKEDFNIKI